MISRQGGDPDAPLPLAPQTETVTAPADGVLTTLDALAVGVAAWRLGAGRARKEDPVQAVAGVTMHAKPGDEVRAGQPLLTLSTGSIALGRSGQDGHEVVGKDGGLVGYGGGLSRKQWLIAHEQAHRPFELQGGEEEILAG